MGKSQPMYRIEATERCKTHRPGTQIDYTGPRSNVPKHWRVVDSIKTYGCDNHLSGEHHAQVCQWGRAD